MQCVVVVFPDHTHLRFGKSETKVKKKKKIQIFVFQIEDFQILCTLVYVTKWICVKRIEVLATNEK